VFAGGGVAVAGEEVGGFNQALEIDAELPVERDVGIGVQGGPDFHLTVHVSRP